MEHEKGDPNVKVDRRAVSEGFRAVGARLGDTVMFHGSLSSMGTVEGGPGTVTDGALDAVGPTGTVAMPSLWFNGRQPLQDPRDFDPRTSPSYVGALSEALRADPRSVRSNDFSHSVSAIGARAAALTAGHDACPPLHTPWSLRAFSDGSPWDRLYEWDALYAFVGVNMRVCTMKHYVETRIVAECLHQAAPERRAALEAKLVRFGVPGIWAFYSSEELGFQLAKAGLVAFAKIGSATVQAIRTRTLVDETFKALHAAPETWFGQPFREWRQECLARG